MYRGRSMSTNKVSLHLESSSLFASDLHRIELIEQRFAGDKTAFCPLRSSSSGLLFIRLLIIVATCACYIPSVSSSPLSKSECTHPASSHEEQMCQAGYPAVAEVQGSTVFAQLPNESISGDSLSSSLQNGDGKPCAVCGYQQHDQERGKRRLTVARRGSGQGFTKRQCLALEMQETADCVSDPIF